MYVRKRSKASIQSLACGFRCETVWISTWIVDYADILPIAASASLRAVEHLETDFSQMAFLIRIPQEILRKNPLFFFPNVAARFSLGFLDS
jgi:hypothetical protein